MALTGVVHHSPEKVAADATNFGPRALTTVSVGGVRPGVLEEPGAQWVDAVLSYRAAAGAPLLVVPSLASGEDETVAVVATHRRRRAPQRGASAVDRPPSTRKDKGGRGRRGGRGGRRNYLEALFLIDPFLTLRVAWSDSGYMFIRLS